jgi:excisionase family DNA binding protein
VKNSKQPSGELNTPLNGTDQYITRVRAAELACCDPQTVDAWIEQRKLAAYKPGGARKVLINLAEFRHFMKASKI